SHARTFCGRAAHDARIASAPQAAREPDAARLGPRRGFVLDWRTQSDSGQGGIAMDIGFIGLGQMGFHMARRLVEAGPRLIVSDMRREPIDRLTALGAQAAGSAREIADAVETVMASLPTPEIVLEVATGKGGVIEGKQVRRFVDLSTTGAVMAKRIFELLKEKGIVQIDCPVSGGVTGASK